MRRLLLVAALLGSLAAKPADPVSISLNRRVGLPGVVHVRVNVEKNTHNRLLIYGFDNGNEAQNTEAQLDEYTTGGVFERDFTVHYAGPVAFVAVVEKDDGHTVMARIEACFGGADDGC